ncbi:GntR family transcriptional regulator [Cellulosilyticum sp. ST5]|uniref:Transcriptional regulator, GntR family n=1 Tax=Cellulosilyticum lentocellum (strain ATCC 49066 / DSM 5427 / NCIMB 11756 / RHM5) TaxID=642492 RepID=F2JRT5_CELLD|nr:MULTISPECIES: GntR family transcriptional regulator [Cellulosilyticum]ADZ85115.1 transcriptional regulator, GntR family [Cellulosilyticum lentocellum DSM 5427]QEH70663.1 GntR family transcriptional regulator [Cellulosilyticum sp. WCF-2]
MDIIIVNDSAIPLYEQIISQIKEHILKGEIQQGTLLPSIRMMAKELKVSIITVKRAYEDLEAEGFVQTTPGKGTYVSLANKERLKEMQMSQLEEKLEAIVVAAKSIDMTLEELQERVAVIYEEV